MSLPKVMNGTFAVTRLHLLEYDRHQGMQKLHKDLNHLISPKSLYETIVMD